MTTDDLARIGEALRAMAEALRDQRGREGDPRLCLVVAEMHLDHAARLCQQAKMHLESHVTAVSATRSAGDDNLGGRESVN